MVFVWLVTSTVFVSTPSAVSARYANVVPGMSGKYGLSMTVTNCPAPGNVGSVACTVLASLGSGTVGLVGPGSPHALIRNARAAIAAENAAPLVSIIIATSVVELVCRTASVCRGRGTAGSPGL